MNRQRVLKQRAARNGVGIMHSMDGSTKGWDVADSCGPHGLALTRREAISRAAQMGTKKPKFRLYGTDASGMWHRWNCEKVACLHVASKPCKCQRLVV